VGGDDGPKKIKVVDRRWFTDDGQPREGLGDANATPVDTGPVKGSEAVSGPAPEPSPSSPADKEGEAPPVQDRPTPKARKLPTEITMLHLIDFLAQQAVILLSGAHGVTKDPEQARLFIDFLGVLDAATRGNLTAEEAGLLSDVLFQLRTLYVQSSQ
jgi:hypothetical protein